MTTACYAIPVLLTIASFLGELSNYDYYQRNEDVRELVVLTNIATQNELSDNLLYQDAKTVLTGKLQYLFDDNSKQRNHRFVTSMMALHPKFREDLTEAFEKSLPSESEIESALERIKGDPRYSAVSDVGSINWLGGFLGPMIVGPTTLLSHVALPALLAGLFFKGGLIIHGFRTVIVNMDGYPVGRFRIALRNILPLAAILAVCLLWYRISVYPLGLMTLLGLIFFYGLAIVSNFFGTRSLADRIVGTAVVVRE